MNGNTGPIGEDDLHAYVDGQLEAGRRREVEAYLEAHPERKLQLEALAADAAALRDEARGDLSSPVPMRLRLSEIRRAQRGRDLVRLGQVAAGILLLVSGAVLGSLFSRPGPAARPPMADAMAAHRVFAMNTDGAVEFDGLRRAVLVSRVSDHLGQVIAIPDLSGLGLAFLGGRLLASDEGPGGMFIYAEPDGKRIAVYLKSLADGRRSAFSSRQDGDVVAYYWFDGRLGHAVTGQAGSPMVGRVAGVLHETYR